MATDSSSDTTPSVATYDVSVDFASEPYDANSAARYDANLDANSDVFGLDVPDITPAAFKRSAQ